MRSSSAKREQQLYSPGSGPLRKTQRSDSNRSLNIPHPEPSPSPTRTNSRTATRRNSARMRSPSNESSRGQDYAYRDNRGQAGGSANRRLDSHGYHPGGAGMHYVRHESEPPMASANSSMNVEPTGSRNGRPELNRDSRWKKPPILSIAHLEILPPRLLKKTLQDNGLPPDYLDILRAEQQRNQALARSSHRHSKGRVRYSGSGNGGGGGGGGGGGYANANHGGRWKAEEHYRPPRSRSSDIGADEQYEPVDRNRVEYQPRCFGSRHSSCDRTDRPRTNSSGGANNYPFNNRGVGDNDKSPHHSEHSLDVRRESAVSAASVNDVCNWFEDDSNDEVLAVEVKSANFNAATDVDGALPPPSGISSTFTGNNRNRHRMRSGGSHSLGRGAAGGRYYGPDRDTSRDRYFGGGGSSGDGSGRRFRPNSRDRYQTHSREAGMDRAGRNADPVHPAANCGNWRRGGSDSRDQSRHPPSDQAVNTIAEMTKQFENSVCIQKGPGVLVLPPKVSTSGSAPDRVRPGESVRNGGRSMLEAPSGEPKLLFDPKNPSRPIVVEQPQLRPNRQDQQHEAQVSGGARREKPRSPEELHGKRHQVADAPAWYNPNAPQAKLLRQRHLVYPVAAGDVVLHDWLERGRLIAEWDRYEEVRWELQQALETFLRQDMRFAQDVNLEHHFWKLMYYNVIDKLRKLLAEATDQEEKQALKKRALEVVENGIEFFEKLLGLLERVYEFSLEKFVGANAATNVKGLRYALALVSAQKICLFLGDLARYREQITEGNSFRKSRLWYERAQQILPKNGRPYNQLALLSIYAKRKVDAVYFYMRSLMSSNPFESARESLMDLFNETKKKYERKQSKREEKRRLRLKEREHRFDGNLRRETWIHPDGGSRVHRTALLDPLVGGAPADDTSDEEELRGLGPIELNQRFIISFLHVLGKLVTKTGMESFNQCLLQMLLEFRAMLQHSPIPVYSNRLVQLVSLNMFAIEITKLKAASTTSGSAAPGSRSELQECALVAGLLMFGIVLERFVQVLRNPPADYVVRVGVGTPTATPAAPGTKLILHQDAKDLLPSIKVWCDWMIFHPEMWNPPPSSCSDYKLGNSSAHDPWSNFAELINILKNVDTNREILATEQAEGFVPVRLPEDITLAGFTPLMYNEPEPIYVHRACDMEEAQNALRIQKLIYFGSSWLCSCDPPVLGREPTPSAGNPSRYFSVVKIDQPIEELTHLEIMLESFSDEEPEEEVLGATARAEESEKHKSPEPNADESSSSNDPAEAHAGGGGAAGVTTDSSLDTRKLLRRKDELERRQRMQEKHNQRLQDILSQSTIALHIEVRPRLLVPDTNCFVDYLPAIELIARGTSLYQLMVPIIVINELEGLSKGIRQPSASSAAEMLEPANLQHITEVAEASKQALLFIKSRNPNVKCVTTKGSVLKTTTFTVEDEGEPKSNDDRILETALNLCRQSVDDTRDGTRYVTRDVVLLTTDRNLRVKALSNELPVRELPDFVKWAGLGDA